MTDSIKSVSKAIAGMVATLVVAYLAKKNIVIEGNDVSTVVQYAVAAVLGFITVYLAPKNKA
jgi:hypothetical protein